MEETSHVRLLARNRVRTPATIRSLARAAQMSGPVSLREPMLLLGPAAFGARPFYVIGHNPNTIREVEDALDQGANAVEPDVNVSLLDGLRVCISHFRGLPTAPPLVEFLQDLRAVALARPGLALVLFDCKVSRPRFGRELLDAIRTHLTRHPLLPTATASGSWFA